MRKLLAGLLLLLVPTAVICGWETVKTESFVVFYPQGYEEQALELLNVLEAQRPAVEQLTGNSIRKLSVVLAENGSEVYAFSDSIYRRMHLYTHSPFGGSLGFGYNWWTLVGVHEYIHALHISNSSAFPGLLAFVFGNIMAPNNYTPSWLTEGISVYGESRLSPYLGRLNEGSFDAFAGALVSEGTWPSIEAATFGDADYPGGNAAYLYGGMFFEYLLDRYGEERFTQFADDFGAWPLSYLSPLFPFLGLDLMAKKTFGRTYRQLWADWREAEIQRQSNYTQPGDRLTDQGWRMGNPVITGDKLYYTRAFRTESYPFNPLWRYQLIQRDLITETEEVLWNRRAPFSGDLRIRDNTLYVPCLQIRSGYANAEFNSFGYLTDLYAFELSTGKKTRLLRDELRTYTVLADGSILYARDRVGDFGSELLCWKPDETRLLYSGEILIGELLAAEGQLFVSARRDWENFSLYALDLAAVNGLSPKDPRLGAVIAGALPIAVSNYHEGGLSYSEGQLFFSPNYDGRRAIYSYDLERRRVFRHTDQGYAVSAVLDSASGALYFIGLNPDGHDLYRLKTIPIPASVPPKLEAFSPPPEAAFDRGGYGDNLKTLAPRMLLPLLEIDTRSQSVLTGASLHGLSALGDITYIVGGLYDFSQQKFHVDLSLETRVPPLTFTSSFRSKNQNELIFGLEWPLFRSLSNGITGITLGLETAFWENEFARKELAPFINLNLQAGLARSTLSVRTAVERQAFFSTQNSLSLIFGTAFQAPLFWGTMQLESRGVIDLSGQSWILPELRGYTAGLIAEFGMIATLEYALRLFSIRRGIWNPSLYWEDVLLIPFFDVAVNERLELQVAGGTELHVELKALSLQRGIPLDVYLRLTLNRAHELSLDVGVGATLIGSTRADRIRAR